MVEAWPAVIKYWCPEGNKMECMDLGGEHPPYLYYICREHGRAVLVPMGLVGSYVPKPGEC